MGPAVSDNICQSEPKRSINLRSGPKHVSQIPKKKTSSPSKQSCNQTQEKRPNHGDQDKAIEIEEVNMTVKTLILRMNYVRTRF